MKCWVATVLLVGIAGCGSQPESKKSSSNPVPLITATVVSYNSNVEWDHFDDGSFDVRDQLELNIAPDDKKLVVSLPPNELPDESPFRITGTRFTFRLEEPHRNDAELFWNAIIDPTVLE